MTAKTEEKSLLLEVWDALSFSEIRTAMRVALKHMFVKPVTFQYPREKRTIPDAHRGALGLLRYDDGTERSEEHTSELQSRPHLVCRLLLEKKKNNSPPKTSEQT